MELPRIITVEIGIPHGDLNEKHTIKKRQKAARELKTLWLSYDFTIEIH